MLTKWVRVGKIVELIRSVLDPPEAKKAFFAEFPVLRRNQWILLGIWAQYYAHLRIKFYWESEDHENDLD